MADTPDLHRGRRAEAAHGPRRRRRPMLIRPAADQAGREHKRGRGRPFSKGRSGNAGGRPKGSKTYSVLRFVQAALARRGTEAGMLKVFADRLKAEARRDDLEFMARLTREVGAESVVVPSMTINVYTNVDPSRL